MVKRDELCGNKPEKAFSPQPSVFSLSHLSQFSPKTENKGVYWFVFNEGKLILKRDGTGVPVGTLPPIGGYEEVNAHHIGELDGLSCIAYEANGVIDESRYYVVPLRDSFEHISRPYYEMAGRGSQLIFWDKTTQYCGRCGGRTERRGPIMKRCTGCGVEIFPQIAPAIIVLVHRGDDVLMVRAHNFKGTHYGLVAGFLEPGESLETCVHREVLEETGLTITNIRYFGSQPWPYPCGEMIGFHADYVSGEINIQEEELKEAKFFSRDALPELPSKLSLARALVDDWLNASE